MFKLFVMKKICVQNNLYVKIVIMTIDGSDSLVPVEREKIIIPQLGNEPGTS